MKKHIRITGTVQGVGYRAAFESEALTLQLAGWVRNRADGSVEAVIAGPQLAVERMIDWSRRGPVGAHVYGVTATDAEDDISITPGIFKILPSL